MPAYEEEVAEAEKEGVRFEFLSAPSEIVSKNGHVSGLRCGSMKLGMFDRSGRKSPVPTGESGVVEADEVILAIGQTLTSDRCFGENGPVLGRRNFVEVDPLTGKTSLEGIYAGGDMVSGPASVVDAVAGGEKAAYGIDLFLSGENHAFWRSEKTVDTFFDPDEDPVEYERAPVKLVDVEQRSGNFCEVELGWKESAAIREAKRCLRCDYREQSEEQRR